MARVSAGQLKLGDRHIRFGVLEEIKRDDAESGTGGLVWVAWSSGAFGWVSGAAQYNVNTGADLNY